jgi:hypothetical protein
VAYTIGNQIVGNLIHDIMQLLSDGGGIYCNGVQQSGLISGNYIYNDGHYGANIYLDNGSTDWTVVSNVVQVADVSGEYWLFYNSGGGDNNADYNYTDNGSALNAQGGGSTLAASREQHHERRRSHWRFPARLLSPG